MQFIKLQVYNYLRLGANPNNKRVEYTPSTGMQVILGSNGSGKTSLLEILFGMPPEPKDLLENGEIITTIGHNNKLYELSAKRDDAVVRYSFIEDGVELNTASKVTVQRQLLMEYLGINGEIIELMTGNNSLTSMSKAKRKDWMIRSSKSDFTFILGIYDKVKKRYSYIRTVAEHTSKKLDAILTSPESISEESIERLDLLKNTLEDLLSDKRFFEGGSKHSLEDYERQVKGLKKLIKDWRREKAKVTNLASTFCEHRVIDTERVTMEEEHLERSLNELDKELEKTYEKIASKERTVVSLDEMPSEAELMESIESVTYRKPEISGTDEELSRMRNISEYILDTHEAFIPLEVTDSELYEMTVRTDELDTVLGRLKKSAEIYGDRLKEMLHLKTHTEVNCPACSNTFYNSIYDPAEEVRVSEESVKVEGELVAAETELNQLLGSIQQCKHTQEYLSKLKKYCRNTRYAGIDFNVVGFSLNDFNNRVIADKDMVENFLLNAGSRKEQDRLKSMLTLRRELVGTIASVQSEVLDELDQYASELLDKKNELFKTLEYVKRVGRGMDNLLTSSKHIQSQRDVLVKMREEAIEDCRQEAIHKQVIDIKGEITELEEELYRSRERDNSITKLEIELKDLRKYIVVVKEIEKRLSPKSGLIGLSVRSYMEAFINIMNTHISNIWESEMRLVLPDITKMDYSFPVKLGHLATPSSDVVETSVGQSEVIDLAYKLTMMQMLGMTDHPLILDEFGVFLDKAHRVKAYSYIVDLSESGAYSCVFLVSHYADLYGALNANTEYTVLDDRNIEKAGLPNKLNTAIKRSPT